jgi:hypothetical protein
LGRVYLGGVNPTLRGYLKKKREVIEMNNEELIKTWKEGEKKQRELWTEILQRGLYLIALGVDPSKRDNSWRTPPTATGKDINKFFAGVHGAPHHGTGTGEKFYKRPVTPVKVVNLTQDDLNDFV